jgi:hypothetical protein
MNDIVYMPKMVYIAGPYQGVDEWQTHMNIENARRFGADVARLGANPFVPHANTAHYTFLGRQWWLDCDLQWLSCCDAMFVMPNYETSAGTLREIQYADQWRIPVFYSLVSLTHWLTEQEGKK